MLSVLVVLHEYGHFIVARRNGVRVNEFAVGMGPKIVGWTSSAQRHAVLDTSAADRRLLRDARRGRQNERGGAAARISRRSSLRATITSKAKSPWQRLGDRPRGTGREFHSFVRDSARGCARVRRSERDRQPRHRHGVSCRSRPAAAHGLQPGDQIVAVRSRGYDVTNEGLLIDRIHASLGKTIDVTYERTGGNASQVTPQCPTVPARRRGCIGFLPAPAYRTGRFR